MLLKPLTAVAGVLVLPASRAFLIPPEVSDADILVANTIESIGSQVAESQVVDVKCPRCPILVRTQRGKNIQLKTHRPTHLELTFTVDHQPDHDRLLVNGFELYPSGDPLHDVLSAPQVSDHGHLGQDHDDHDNHDRQLRKRPHSLTPQPQRLGFGLHVGASQKDADGKFELVEVELQILQVGPAFIRGIPSVKVKLIKDAGGRLLMSRIEQSTPKKLLELPSGGPEECKTVMCRWLAIARERLEKLKQLGHCHDGMRPHVSGKITHPHPHHNHPPGPGHWTSPYREHRWGKLFKHIGSHIFFPVIIGILAGVAVSIMGMALGTSIVYIWRLFRHRGHRGHRRRHSGHAHHKAAHKEAALTEEKSSLMKNQDLPPSYEEAETPKTEDV